jgi:hypothetical protein
VVDKKNLRIRKQSAIKSKTQTQTVSTIVLRRLSRDCVSVIYGLSLLRQYQAMHQVKQTSRSINQVFLKAQDKKEKNRGP